MIESHPGTTKRIRGEWFVLFAAVLWGTTGTAQAFAPPAAQPAAVGTLRLLSGGLALLVYAVFRGSFESRNAWPVRLVFLSAVSVAAYQLFFFASVRETGVATGTLVAIGSAPILAGVLARLFQRETPSSRWVVSTALAIMGCALLLGSNSQEGDFTWLGFGLALGAGFSYAGYSVTTKQILENQSPEAAVAVVFTLGGILLSPILLFNNLSWLSQGYGVIAIVHLGLIATALAYILFAKGLKLIPVSTAVTLTLAEPLTAAFLGVFVLREKVTWFFLGGMLLLFVGLAILAARPAGQPLPMRDASGS